MTIEQTVEIPASPPTDGTRNIERVDEQMPHGVGPLNAAVTVNATGRWLTIKVPYEVPAGKTILTFTPAADDYVCPHCGKTEHIPNAVTIAAMEEGDAILRGEIPAKRYKSVDEFWKDLNL
ncbi:hypothetical protein AGMMS50230_14020 [Spirochaetia bacterium]|nr:hypothetical protein AGMMS50230_14020 [Spirochaetia bacterium]